MKSLVPIQNLDISDGLKTILAKNYVFFLDDFLSSSVGIFKNHFELTLCDWQSIFEVFRTYNSVKRISDTTIYAAFREKNPESYNALLINVFDEKYVVATIKNGKRLHDGYIYKSIARGIVFLSREEATSFSEAIAQNNNSKIIEFKIESAQDKIYVINAFSHQKKQSLICFDRQLDENQIFKAISEGKIFMEPHRAHKLAAQSVERINSIYDYEIASLLTLFCDEDNHSAKEIDAIGTENDEICADIDTDDRCVDPKRYSARLKQLYDCTGDSFFDWGKNEALSLDAPKSSRACKGASLIAYRFWRNIRTMPELQRMTFLI